MGELTNEEQRMLLNIFLHDYNKEMGTGLEVEDLCSCKNFNLQSDIDIALKNSENILLLQITRMVGNARIEYQEPNNIIRFVEEIKKKFTERKLKCALHCSFKKVPPKNKVGLIVRLLTDFVERRVSADKEVILELVQDEDFLIMQEIAEYFSYFRLSYNEKFSIGHGLNLNGFVSRMDDLQRFLGAYDKKIKKVKTGVYDKEETQKIVLIVEVDGSPLFDDGVQRIKEYLKKEKKIFKNIWIVNWRFLSSRGAWKVK